MGCSKVVNNEMSFVNLLRRRGGLTFENASGSIVLLRRVFALSVFHFQFSTIALLVFLCQPAYLPEVVPLRFD